MLLVCAPVFAEDIYITQSGAGTGASCSDTRSAAWFNDAANWGGGAGEIDPGDTVHLCGTFTAAAGATGFLEIRGSGTAGNPITIKLDSGAVLQAPYWGENGAIYANGKSYIVVDGGTDSLIQATLSGSPDATCPGGACQYREPLNVCGVVFSASSNIEAKNLTIRNLYVHTGTGDDQNGGSIGISVRTGGDLSFHHNTMSHLAAGVFVSYRYAAGANVSIFNNDISYVNHGIAVGDAAADSVLTNLNIYNNTIHEFANWNTTSNTSHHNGIYVWAEQSGGVIAAPYNIYNNYIYGDFGGANCTAGIFTSGSGVQSPYIFNNVIDQSVSGCGNGAISLLNITTSPNVLNNTVIGGILYGPNGTGATGVLKNNIWSFTSPAQAMYNTTAGLAVSDYNNWYNLASGAFFYGNAWYTTATWVSTLGFDAHGITGNPLLTAAYRLGAGSPAIGAGTNLSSVCNGQPNPGLGALCYDAVGRVRPLLWSIGAFEFAPPTTLRGTLRGATIK